MLICEPKEQVKGKEFQCLNRYWTEWMRTLKRQRAHINQCGKSTEIVDAKIAVLKDCIRQLNIVRPKRGVE